LRAASTKLAEYQDTFSPGRSIKAAKKKMGVLLFLGFGRGAGMIYPSIGKYLLAADKVQAKAEVLAKAKIEQGRFAVPNNSA